MVYYPPYPTPALYARIAALIPCNLFYSQRRTPLLKKLFVGNLPGDATEASVLALFSQFGKVRSLELVTDLFNGRCKGFGFIGMEGHEARAAIAKLDGFMYGDKPLKVNFEDSSGKKGKRR